MATDRGVAATNQPSYRMRWRVHNHEAEQKWMLVNRVPLHNDRGEVVGVLSSAEDIYPEHDHGAPYAGIH